MFQNEFRNTPYNTQRVFKSEMFKNSYSITTGSTVNLGLQTPVDKDIHVTSFSLLSNTTEANFKLIENGFTVAGSTAIPSQGYNVDLIDGTTSGSVFSLGTNYVVGGTTLLNVSLVNNIVWEMITPELILTRNTKYLLRIPKPTAGVVKATFTLVWYPESN